MLYQNENSLTVTYLIFYLFSSLKILVNTCIHFVFRLDNRQHFYVINQSKHSPFGIMCVAIFVLCSTSCTQKVQYITPTNTSNVGTQSTAVHSSKDANKNKESSMAMTAQHPSLGLTKEGVALIRAGLNKYPLFTETFNQAKKEVEQAMATGVDVPFPKDMAGSYTHEQHKRNYKVLQKAGNLYQITNDERYAKFVKEVFFDYAELYPTIDLHPAEKSYARGKLFWQCLNDANWMVFSSQAYDCIYDYLTADERDHLETNLFLPYANFLSEGNPRFFNRIHNHSTWANAAVGMMALAMDNDTLLQKALYGLADDGIDPNEVDNDGGYIKKDGVRQAGFLAQLDYSFSPDGYFPEGPYYLRYAIFPFLVFSQALNNNKPELDIYNYRDKILLKSTKALLQLTNPQGEFFPINDAQKGMNLNAYELITAVDIMFAIDPTQTEFLSWANAQKEVTLNESGFLVAKHLKELQVESFKKDPIILGDGITGTEGGVAVLRSDNTDLLFKFSTQGMGHGHFDRLSYSLFNDTGEVIQDYGAVRWVNVDQKGGGRYLPENKTFGKQTIGHNTLVVDQTSHFKGSVKLAEKAHPELYVFQIDENVQIVSAKESNAYDDVVMARTLFLIEDDEFKEPLIIDLLNVNSKNQHSYDLPIWYKGQIMQTSATCPQEKSRLEPLGVKNGYQHIWNESICKATDQNHFFNWFSNNRFYTMVSLTDSGDEIILGRAGANDPNHNLRYDPVMIHRKKQQSEATYLSIIEAHGEYDRATEIPIQPYGSIKRLHLDYYDKDYISFQFSTESHQWRIVFSQSNSDKTAVHRLNVSGKEYNWIGLYTCMKTEIDQ